MDEMPIRHLSIYAFTDDTFVCAVFEPLSTTPQQFRISYNDAWTILQNLASALRIMVDERLRSAVAGNCPTCKNLRLVEQKQRGGQIESVYCPDCSERYKNAQVHFVTGSHPA